jgi:hypothetical protein
MDKYSKNLNTDNKENEFIPNTKFTPYTNSKSHHKRSVSCSKNNSKQKNPSYNFDFSKEKEHAKHKAIEEFSEICDNYEILQILGKGSYGIVAKVINKCSLIKIIFRQFRNRLKRKWQLRNTYTYIGTQSIAKEY